MEPSTSLGSLSASASKSALLLSPCLRWASDSAKEFDDRHADTTKRDNGTLFHSAMEAFIRGGHVPDMPEDVDSWWLNAIGWWSEHMVKRCFSYEAEVYVAYNFATGEVHTDPTVHNRQYPKMPGFLPGTADLVCVLLSGELLVSDWKTGGGTGAEAQLMSLACGLRKVYPMADGSVRDVLLSVLYAGNTSDGNVHPVEWAVTEGDLLAHEYAMAKQLARIGTKEASEPDVGIHCTQLYCPHLAYCPGITAIVEDLSESPQALLQPESMVRRSKGMTMTDMPISDDEAGYVMERITAAKRQMKYLEDCMRKYITDGGRAVSGDFEFKQTNSGFRWGKRGA